MLIDVEHQLKALASEPRLRIVNVLAAYELSVGELVQVLGLGQSKISRNLKILLDAGLVGCRREGQRAFYRAAANGAGRKLIAPVQEALVKDKALARELDRAGEVRARRERETREFFNAIADRWDRLSMEVLGDFDLAGELSGRVPESRTAADLGCGTGELVARLIGRAERVIGVDNAPAMLEAAAERLGESPSVSLRLGELEHLPLRDREADAVVLSMVLHHLSEPKEAVAEAVRVLRPGGVLLAADFEPHGEESMREEYGDLRLGVDPLYVRDQLEAAGLSVVSLVRRKVNKSLTVFVLEASRS